MNELINISNRNLEKALRITKELRIKEIAEALGFSCNPVGSVITGLLMTRRDIDFHVYSDDYSVTKSFELISRISENRKIKDAVYKNLSEEEDMCFEWHLSYEEDPQQIWTIDIIHIDKRSPYAGMIERVTEKINAVMTEKLKESILKIKHECEQNDEKIPGITIYQAVIDDKTETYEDFTEWRKDKKRDGISLWEPRLDK